MSLTDFLEKIQRKPRYVRLQILWLAVFICMVFIVSLWVVSLKSSLPETTAEKAKTPLDEIKKEIPSLKETLKASIGAFFEKDLEDEFEELESQEENIEQVPVLEESKKIKPAKLPLSP
jgi:hypothetical protein